MVATMQNVRITTEVRGAVAQLWREKPRGEWMIDGPAGTGKTRGVLEWIHQQCQERTLRVLFVRKTLESLKSSVMVTYQEQVLHDFDGKRSVLDGVTYFGGNKLRPAQFTYQATGSVIVLGGMDNPEKIKSTEWDIIYPNEATELDLNDWEMMTGRTDRPSLDQTKEPGVVLGDCNPGPPTHWIQQRAQEGTLRILRSKHEDNPAMWDRKAKRWTVSGQRYLDRLDTLTGVRYQRLRLGNWVAAEGQVYESWDEAVHLIPRVELPADWDRVWSVDFGFTNPFVWGCWAIDHDGRMILEWEFYRTRTLVVDAATEIMRHWGGRREPIAVVTDHDAEDRATFERATGLYTTAANKEVSHGIQLVSDRLRVQDDGRPRMLIMRDTLIHKPDEELKTAGKPTCTAQEFPTYVWDERQASKMRSASKTRSERPLKQDDHGMDMSRYATALVDADATGFEMVPDGLSTIFTTAGIGD